jgi:glycine/D-amino acid oxidase-like deaminating enzyme
MQTDCDLIIAGNGVLALSTAHALSQENPSMRMAIVGPAAKPGSASLAAGAMLASFAEIEKGAIDSAPCKRKFEMSLSATRMWPEWVESLNRAAGKKLLSLNLGTYVIHNARADELDDENYRAVIETLARYKEEFAEVDPAEVPGLVPAPESRPLKVIHIPNEGYLNSHHLAQVLTESLARTNQIEMFNDFASRIRIGDDGRKELQLSGGRKLVSQKLLIACGAKSQELIDQLAPLRGRIPRLVYGVGAAMVIKTEGYAPPKVLRTLNRGLACGIHLVPYDKDVCYIGASNFITPIPEYHPRMTSLFLLMQAAMEQLNRRLYKAQIVETRVGHRPTTIDTFPLIGETSIPGLWILSGTKRDGIHMSPLLAQSTAREMLGRKGLFENGFKPERSLIHTLSREEGIRKAVKHLKSAAIQHELHLPKAGWDEMIEDMLRRKVEAIYEQCGIKDFGIPPEMLDMYKYGHTGATTAA